MNVKAEVLFAMVPQWVIEADIQATSVRVYSVLARAANQTSKKTTVGHKKIATRSRSSVATVKRAIIELETIGALVITRRGGKQGELQITNEYLVKMIPPQVVSELGDEESGHEHEDPQVTDEPGVVGEPVPQVTGELPGSSPVSQNQEPVLEPDHQEKPLATASPRDLAFEALCNIAQIDWHELTKNGRGAVNAALAQIREVAGEDGLDMQIRSRAVNYRLHFGAATLTPSALAKHWAQCANPPSRHALSPAEETAAQLVEARREEAALNA